MGQEVAAGTDAPALAELELSGEPDAAPRARRLVASALAGTGLDVLVADAELAVTELVTNAQLHGSLPASMRLVLTGGHARIEVRDSSRVAPVLGLASGDMMTGRGLTLVAALSVAWGAEPRPDGKVVWCELSPDSPEARPDGSGDDADVDALLAAWSDDDDEPVEARYPVTLGDVPTPLLLAAKAHVDNLVREFSLAAQGAESGHSADMTQQMAGLVDGVVRRFAEAREAIKRQALAAARRGEPRTALSLSLPLSAADAGVEYLRALDQADSYARAARLLTVETTPAHRAFRTWYVESIITQLRAAAAGEVPPPPQSFEARLIDELGALAASKRLSERAALLTSVMIALADASEPADIGHVLVHEGLSGLGASAGVLAVGDPGSLRVAASTGYDHDDLEVMADAELLASTPAFHALTTGESHWLESRQDRDARFPALQGRHTASQASCVVPVHVEGRVIGVLGFSFDRARIFEPDDRDFVHALASQGGQALRRAELLTAERAARGEAEKVAARLAQTAIALRESAERLRLLQDITAELTGARDVEEICSIVVGKATETLGALSARIYLLDESRRMLRSSRTSGGDPRLAEAYDEFPLDAALPGGDAIRTGRPVLLRDCAEMEARYPLLEGTFPTDRSTLVAPLIISEHRLGVLALSFLPDQQVDEATQVTLLTTLADTAAQAIERAQATARAQVARDRLSFLAEASVALSSSLDYSSTLVTVARLVVPRMADWCAIHIVDDGEVTDEYVAHKDPDKVAWAEQLALRYPTDLSRDSGVGEVVRTGNSELYPTIPPDLLAASAIDEEHHRILREVGMSSVLIAPLTGRAGSFGAITMIHAESGRHYDEADRTFAEDLARRAALAIETAHLFHEQTGRLAAVTQVADAAQRAILAPVPEQIGPVGLAARYVSAASEALIGGDLYEVVPYRDRLRLIIGDVRGKGLEAVRMATIALGEFRAAASSSPTLVGVATQIDERLRLYLGDEDFVTALLAEIADDGTLTVASCGHPPALLLSEAGMREIGTHDSLPLGLGATPTLMTTELRPGTRLLLFTDGLLEARDSTGAFVDARALAAPLQTGDLDKGLEQVLSGLRAVTGPELGDDLALLVAEYRP